jgi:hypothetical protein
VVYEFFFFFFFFRFKIILWNENVVTKLNVACLNGFLVN